MYIMQIPTNKNLLADTVLTHIKLLSFKSSYIKCKSDFIILKMELQTLTTSYHLNKFRNSKAAWVGKLEVFKS